MKNTLLVLLLSISSLHTASAAGIRCEVPQFVGPDEVFSLDSNPARALLSWSGGHYTSLEKALKFFNPSFQDRVTRVEAAFRPQECQTTPRKTFLYTCQTAQPGSIRVTLASGRKLALKGKVFLDTQINRHSQLQQGQIQTQKQFNVLLRLEIYNLGSRTPYAADEGQFRGCR